MFALEVLKALRPLNSVDKDGANTYVCYHFCKVGFLLNILVLQACLETSSCLTIELVELLCAKVRTWIRYLFKC